jgi:hypothetical protein
MPFAYYGRLSARDKATYLKSDAVAEIRLPQPTLLHPLVEGLRAALEADDRAAVTLASRRWSQLTMMLEAPPVGIEVLAVRPSLRGSGELHGLYTADEGRPPRIQVWMRTMKQRRVVAFRTFLRTLLHEAVHHLDYTHLKLAESFHTEGFFKRESSLFRQLVGEWPASPGAA